MGPKKRRGFTKEIKVGEDLRIAVHLKLQAFRNSEDEKGKGKDFGTFIQADCRKSVILICYFT